ncbi:hypothetical protein TSUD_112760 [Trifolium subterraneum]|uniref:Uncharacterized protein n=1 Tax=Trifolium subterraneum TaxID=3900 RepID=A0A2Z6LFZ2_TRISU|nr:hypothetical protein TSUD_112760 [Trifolium subterraneum]
MSFHSIVFSLPIFPFFLPRCGGGRHSGGKDNDGEGNKYCVDSLSWCETGELEKSTGEEEGKRKRWKQGKNKVKR